MIQSRHKQNFHHSDQCNSDPVHLEALNRFDSTDNPQSRDFRLDDGFLVRNPNQTCTKPKIHEDT